VPNIIPNGINAVTTPLTIGITAVSPYTILRFVAPKADI
jgi:hypothetical protein